MRLVTPTEATPEQAFQGWYDEEEDQMPESLLVHRRYNHFCDHVRSEVSVRGSGKCLQFVVPHRALTKSAAHRSSTEGTTTRRPVTDHRSASRNFTKAP